MFLVSKACAGCENALLFRGQTYAALPMFANLLQLITGRTPPGEEYDLAFVKDVSVRLKPARNRAVERTIAICWILIVGKCWLVTWLIGKYHVPIHPMWIVAPTVVFALICTAVYWRRP